MCLSLPAKILEIENNKAIVDLGGNIYKADITLLEKVYVGDYILIHAGFGIQKISEEHALETIELIEQMKQVK